MKKLAFALLLAICGAQASQASAAPGADKSPAITITVGASVVPHADILRAAAPALAEAGYELKIVEYTDWIIPNLALEGGELDANFFQTEAFMQDFNAAKGASLRGVLGVHVEPMGAYSAAHRSLEALPKRAQICIPNDPVNEDRALRLLATAGLIKIDADAEQATPLDVTSAKNFRFSELEAAQLPRAYSECDLAVINANYALQIDLNPLRDSLAVEDATAQYANIIAVRAGSEDDAKIKALVHALKSDAVRDFIKSTYDGKILFVGK